MTDASRRDKIGISIEDRTASECHSNIDGNENVCASCYVPPNSPP